ncbi:uncharacterized protein si:dkey-30c15.2 isoform X2 [Sardina pilchardus]|uniref:uncharacterized protein si:dkey-30c15.2 isoform X2 n=1 Tax=Sardina pilchardus TaxID=27697 RepID=UPI002E1292E7
MNATAGLQEWQIDTLSRLYLSTLSFSLVGSASVVLLSIIKRRDLNEQVKPLVQLGSADFLASAVLLGTNMLNVLPLSSALRSNVLLCELALSLSLMFFWISFLLAILYACESTFATQGWRERTEQGDQHEIRRRSRRFGLFYASVWLVPMSAFIVYAVTMTTSMVDMTPVSADNSHNKSLPPAAEYCTSCLLFLHIQGDNCSDMDKDHDLLVRGLLFASLLSVVVICTVVYCKLHSWSRQYDDRSVMSRRRLKGALSSARYIIINTSICWSPALLLLSLSFLKQVTQEQLFPLYILQALFVSLHGFLNSVVYAWRRPNFREAVLGERMPLLSSSHRAYFEESLPTPC